MSSTSISENTQETSTQQEIIEDIESAHKAAASSLSESIPRDYNYCLEENHEENKRIANESATTNKENFRKHMNNKKRIKLLQLLPTNDAKRMGYQSATYIFIVMHYDVWT